MPESVRMARSGTLLELSRVAGTNQFGVTILGSFTTARITVRQDNVTHHGPKDLHEMRTPRRTGWTATIDRYVPVTDAKPTDDISAFGPDVGAMLDLIMDADVNVILFRAELVDGRTFTGNCHWAQDEASMSDEPTMESIQIESTGAWTCA